MTVERRWTLGDFLLWSLLVVDRVVAIWMLLANLGKGLLWRVRQMGHDVMTVPLLVLLILLIQLILLDLISISTRTLTFILTVDTVVVVVMLWVRAAIVYSLCLILISEAHNWW
jgi:hypothetical protein